MDFVRDVKGVVKGAVTDVKTGVKDALSIGKDKEGKVSRSFLESTKGVALETGGLPNSLYAQFFKILAADGNVACGFFHDIFRELLVREGIFTEVAEKKKKWWKFWGENHSPYPNDKGKKLHGAPGGMGECELAVALSIRTRPLDADVEVKPSAFSLVKTMMYLMLAFPLQQRMQLKDSMEQYNDLRRQQKVRLDSFIDEIIFHAFNQSDVLILQMVKQAVSIHSNIFATDFPYVPQPSLGDVPRSLIYPFLCARVSTRKQTVAVLHELAGRLALGGMMAVGGMGVDSGGDDRVALDLGQRFATKSASLTDGRLLSILHMIKQVLTISPVKDVSLLKDLERAVEPFYFRAIPVCMIAKDVLQLLLDEQCSPGASFRRRILAENPGLFSTPASLGVLMAVPRNDGKAIDGLTTNTPAARSVLVLADVASVKAASLASVFHTTVYDEIYWNQFRGLLLLHTLEMSFKLPEGLDMSSCAPDDVRVMCRKAVTVANAAADMDPEEAVVYRERELQPIYTTVIDLLQTSSLRNSKNPKDASLSSNVSMENESKTSSAASIKENPPASRIMASTADQPPMLSRLEAAAPATMYQPRLPDPVFKFSVLECSPCLVTCDDQIESDARSRLEFRYPKTAAYNELKTAVAARRAEGVNTPLPVFVVGDDKTMQVFLCGWVAVVRSDSDQFNSDDIIVCIIPTGANNSVADYLAFMDGWYMRHVHSTFGKAYSIIPWVEHSSEPAVPQSEHDVTLPDDWSTVLRASKHSNSDSLLMANGSSTSPIILSDAYFTRSIFHMLFREANMTLNLSVYDCETWSLPRTNCCCSLCAGNSRHFGPQRTLPFWHRLMLGADVSSNLNGNKGKHSLTNPMLKVRYYIQDHFGVISPEAVTIRRQLHSVVISSFPSAGDTAPLADPTSSALSLRICSDTNETEPEQHTVGVVEVEGVHPFPIVIDGQIMGPFSKIRIRGCRNDSSLDILTVKVKTFFPLTTKDGSSE